MARKSIKVKGIDAEQMILLNRSLHGYSDLFAVSQVVPNPASNILETLQELQVLDFDCFKHPYDERTFYISPKQRKYLYEQFDLMIELWREERRCRSGSRQLHHLWKENLARGQKFFLRWKKVQPIPVEVKSKIDPIIEEFFSYLASTTPR